MPKSRMTQVAEELLQHSGSDNVAWEAVEGRKYCYKVAYPDTTVIISSWSLLQDVAWNPISDLAANFNLSIGTYRLELLDSAGHVDGALLAIPGQAIHQTMRGIYESAHRQTSPAEANIDKVLEYLKGT